MEKTGVMDEFNIMNERASGSCAATGSSFSYRCCDGAGLANAAPKASWTGSANG